jgi:hypothetical protein
MWIRAFDILCFFETGHCNKARESRKCSESAGEKKAPLFKRRQTTAFEIMSAERGCAE